MHEGFENGFQRIGFAFSELRCEDSVAGVAEPELNGLVFFVALPSLGDVGTAAEETPISVGADNLLRSWLPVFARRSGGTVGYMFGGCHDGICALSWHARGALARFGYTDFAGMAHGGLHGLCGMVATRVLRVCVWDGVGGARN